MIDAGANALLRVGALGERAPQGDMGISTHAVFAPHPTGTDDAVPTSVVDGPDGARYVGELTGFPLIPAISNVYRIARGGTPEVCLGGFTQIKDLAFDEAGAPDVLEIGDGTVRPGSLIRVTPAADGDRGLCTRYADGVRSVIATGFTSPTSIAIGPDGAYYVSNRGTAARIGQVIRIAR